MIRAGGQRKTQVSDDRRLQELPHDKGRLDHVAVPRSGVPCPSVQVSRGNRYIFFFFSVFFSGLLSGLRNSSQNLWEVYARNSRASVSQTASLRQRTELCRFCALHKAFQSHHIGITESLFYVKATLHYEIAIKHSVLAVLLAISGDGTSDFVTSLLYVIPFST